MDACPYSFESIPANKFFEESFTSKIKEDDIFEFV